MQHIHEGHHILVLVFCVDAFRLHLKHIAAEQPRHLLDPGEITDRNSRSVFMRDRVDHVNLVDGKNYGVVRRIIYMNPVLGRRICSTLKSVFSPFQLPDDCPHKVYSQRRARKSE